MPFCGYKIVLFGTFDGSEAFMGFFIAGLP
jgi:hypothetical protein